MFGCIDILVNSAGMNIRKPVLEIDDRDWDPVLAVNLKGTLYCCQSVGRFMIAQKHGKIVNVASISSKLGHPARGAYAASKGGLIQLTKVMATEWAPYNICVNAISPAAVDTPFISGLKKDRRRLEREQERIPLGRIATPDDVVGAAVFLSSAAADFITGHNLIIDGGRTVD
jgi:NAD(P)-dependent dehydrogenase (short-subunit alcohol dehydrogenase family)